jgi:hypothetical protein
MKIGEYFQRLRDGHVKVVLGDCSPLIAQYFESCQCDVRNVRDFDFSSESDVFVVSNSRQASDYMIEEVFGNHNCHCAHINPWKLHCNSDEVLAYTLDRILACDVDTALAGRRKLDDIIRTKLRSHLEISSPEATFRAEFVGPVEITNTDDTMSQGWNYSIAEFLEIGLLNFGDKHETGFVVSGEMDFHGIVGFGPEKPGIARDPLVRDLLAAMHASSSKRIRVKENVITSMTLDRADYTDLLFGCFGESGDDPELREETKLKEIAFGCNRLDHTQVDWSKNALINEGVYGFHLGFGLADRASHIDFVHQGDYALSW